MRRAWLSVFALVIATVVGCNRRTMVADDPAGTPLRNVFTDSTLHAERCEPLKPGEDWRRVCTPRDQSPIVP